MLQVHFEPLHNFKLTGWAAQAGIDLSGCRLAIRFGDLELFSSISLHRSDVEEIIGTTGLNAFEFSLRESLLFVSHLQEVEPKCCVENVSVETVSFTNRDVLAWQSLYATCSPSIPDSHAKTRLINDILVAGASFSHYLNSIALFVARKQSDVEFLLQVVDATDHISINTVPDFGCRYQEVKLLIDLGCYEHAYQLIRREAKFQRSSEQSQAFKDLASSFLGTTIHSQVGARSRASMPQTPEEAINLICDYEYLSRLFHDRSWRQISLTPEVLKAQLGSGQSFHLNETFDPTRYATLYSCQPQDAALDLLRDSGRRKAPFPGFHGRYVETFYAISCSQYVHPYLFYLDNPTIFISPSDYFSRGKASSGANNDVWSLERTHGDLFNIYNPKFTKNIQVSGTEARSIHVLVPAFDIKSISAGFFGVFALAKRLSQIQSEYRVRLLFFMEFEFNHYLFEYILSRTTGLEDLLDYVDYHFLSPRLKITVAENEGISFDRSTFSPDDKFVATVWFSAYFADLLSRAILQCESDAPKPFLYLIQDYEVGFHERSSKYVAARQSYDLNYFALISSRPLYEQLVADGIVSGPAAYFHNACAAKPSVNLISRHVSPGYHRANYKHKFLIYGRPEVPRNMFELTALSLQTAYSQGIFGDSWEFYSAGLGSKTLIQLENDFDVDEVKSLPRMTLVDYQDFLGSCDVCLTLMASPHPSLLPFDLSGSGCVVVTNSFQAKNQSYFDDYTSLVLCREANPSALVSAIDDAVKLAMNRDYRAQSVQQFSYPCSWTETWSSKSVSLLLDGWILS